MLSSRSKLMLSHPALPWRIGSSNRKISILRLSHDTQLGDPQRIKVLALTNRRPSNLLTCGEFAIPSVVYFRTQPKINKAGAQTSLSDQFSLKRFCPNRSFRMLSSDNLVTGATGCSL